MRASFHQWQSGYSQPPASLHQRHVRLGQRILRFPSGKRLSPSDAAGNCGIQSGKHANQRLAREFMPLDATLKMSVRVARVGTHFANPPATRPGASSKTTPAPATPPLHHKTKQNPPATITRTVLLGCETQLLRSKATHPRGEFYSAIRSRNVISISDCDRPIAPSSSA